MVAFLACATLLSASARVGKAVVYKGGLPFSVPAEICAARAADLAEDAASLFELGGELFSGDLPARGLLASGLGEFSTDFSRGERLGLRGPEYFLLPERSITARRDASDFVAICLVFSALSERGTGEFVFSRARDIRSRGVD